MSKQANGAFSIRYWERPRMPNGGGDPETPGEETG